MKAINSDKKKIRSKLHIPIVIILDNLRSVANIGNIFRLAEAIRIKKIYTLGYTATPPHPKLKKTSRGTENYIEYKHQEDPITLALNLKKKGYKLIGVETMKNATLLWNSQLSGKIALIFGNEALGIGKSLLEQCEQFLSLPMFGFKNSINVSNCVSAVLYYIAKSYYHKI